MTIQFFSQWNGYEEDGVYALSAPEEARLVAAGVARVFVEGMDGESSSPITRTGDVIDPASIPALQGALGGAVASSAWSTTWDTSSAKDFGDFTVSGALAIVSSDVASRIGGYTQAVLIANGTNVPTFDGTALPEWRNAAGSRNCVSLYRVGNTKFWAIAANAGTLMPVPSAPQSVSAAQILSALTGTPLTWSAATFSGYPAPSISYDVLINGVVTQTGVSSGSVTTPAAGSSIVVRATATNASGSAFNASSALVASDAQIIRLTNLTGITESGGASNWSYASGGADFGFGGSFSGRSVQKLAADGVVALTATATGVMGFHMGFRSSAASGGFTQTLLGLYVDASQQFEYRFTTGASGALVGNGTSQNAASGDSLRLRRVGTTVFAECKKGAGAWVTMNTWTGISAGDLWMQLVFGGSATSVNSITGVGVA